MFLTRYWPHSSGRDQRRRPAESATKFERASIPGRLSAAPSPGWNRPETPRPYRITSVVTGTEIIQSLHLSSFLGHKEKESL